MKFWTLVLAFAIGGTIGVVIGNAIFMYILALCFGF